MSIFEKTPETWPAFVTDAINKIGFLGFVFLGIIFLIVYCGNEDQNTQLVDAIIFQHETLIYSLVWWGLVFLMILLYFGGKNRNLKSKNNVIKEQNKIIIKKDSDIKMLKDALNDVAPNNKFLLNFVSKNKNTKTK